MLPFLLILFYFLISYFLYHIFKYVFMFLGMSECVTVRAVCNVVCLPGMRRMVCGVLYPCIG